jgi:hypothetical protein
MIDSVVSDLIEVAKVQELTSDKKEWVNRAIKLLNHLKTEGESHPKQGLETTNDPATKDKSAGPFKVTRIKDGAILLDAKTGKTWYFQTNRARWVLIHRTDDERTSRPAESEMPNAQANDPFAP